MIDIENMKKDGRRFSEIFWKNNGKMVQKQPQNPIAARQVLYNKDTRPDKVSLAQGMVFNDEDRVRVYDRANNAWYDSVEEADKAGCNLERCDRFKNREGKIYHSPAVFIAHQRALERFGKEQFSDDMNENPCAYGTPTAPALQKAIVFDGEDIYGKGGVDAEKTISYQTVGMASGYRHLTLPVLNSVRRSVDLPQIETVVMGTNFYGAYPATFKDFTIKRYRYMNENGDFDFKSFQKASEMVDPQTTMFLFDMSTGNNFIGTRRTKEDNENIAQVLIDKQIYSEHDIAYPNFDPDFDLEWEVYRILQKAGAPHGVQSSRGKKDKYASRLAFHHLYLGSGEQRAEIFSHFVTENRNTFLAMPDTWMHLAEIARDPSLQEAHKRDNQIFVEIVNNSRKKLSETLSWGWMKKRSGMFDMINITHEGADKLGEEYGIYVVPARNQNLIGKDSLPVEVIRIKHGLSNPKIQRVAEALQKTIKKYHSEPGEKNPDIIIAD
ncbi:MAG: hypothetical protein R6X10_12135 [Desulfobacterales bacterium]